MVQEIHSRVIYMVLWNWY